MAAHARSWMWIVVVLLLAVPSFSVATSAMTFATHAVTGFPGDEPGLAFSPDGSVLVSTFSYYRTVDPAISQEANMDVARSTDAGGSWSDATPSRVTSPVNPNYEGDTALTKDPATGRIYSTHVTLPCMGMETTDDGGRSWQVRPPYCDETTGSQGIVDHPMFFLGRAPGALASVLGHSVLYVCIAGYEGRCARSLDDGVTWAPTTPAFVGSGCAASAFATGADWLSNPGVVASDGTIYVTRSSCGLMQVSASRDMGSTWSTASVASEPPGTHIDFAPVEVATDVEGRAYVVWMSAADLPRLAWSGDHGASWSEPVDLAPPGVTAARFPALVVASPGHVAVAFWSTTSIPNDLVTCDSATCAGMDDALWNETVVVSKDALDARSSFVAQQANPPGDPVARGWDLHNALGDYQTLALAPDGALWIAHGDNCSPTWCGSNNYNGNYGSPYATELDAHTTSVVDVQTAGALLAS